MKIETMIVIAVVSFQGCIGLYWLITRYKNNKAAKKLEGNETRK